jgi:hypothetical protein
VTDDGQEQSGHMYYTLNPQELRLTTFHDSMGL